MSVFAQFLVNGVIAGSVYALLGLCFVLIYKSTGVLNFALGELFMLGAFAGVVYHGMLKVPYALAFALAIATVALVGYGLGKVVAVQVLRFQADVLSTIIATVGISLMLVYGGVLVFGPVPYAFPAAFSMEPISLGPAVMTPQSLGVIAIALAIMVVLFLFFRLTRLGKAMRATSQNRSAAALMGVDVGRIFCMIWMLAAAISAAAGLLLAPMIPVEPGMGIIVVKAFAAAVLGGFTSLPGSIVGGFALGVFENLAGGYVSSAFKEMIGYFVLIAILMIKPTGLFERRVAKKV